MSRFTALVILPSDVENLAAKVEELLSPYNSNLEVAPYREYLDPQEVEKEMQFLAQLSVSELKAIIKDWEVSSDDLETLAKARLDWFEEDEDGIDENGSYQIVTYNPRGKWDWYTLVETEPLEVGNSISYPCRVSELPTIVPYAIVTPDGQWHEFGVDAGIESFAKSLRGDTTVSEEEVHWEQKVREILMQHPDSLAIALRCHS